MIPNASAIVPLLVIFLNIVLPKGGVAVEDAPITWANIAAILGAVIFAGVRPRGYQKFGSWLVQSKCFVLYPYFFGWFVLLSLRDFDLFANVFEYLAGLFVFPLLACVTIYAPRDTALPVVGRAYCVFAIVLVIWSFILYVAPDLHIAGITANARDIDKLFTEKNNGGRGLLNLLKMIGTHQNGNILGANLLVHIALISQLLSNGAVGKKLARTSIILLWVAVPFTLSRTVVFAGIVFFLFLSLRRVRVTGVGLILASLFVGILIVGGNYALQRFGLTDMFLNFDSTFGGRVLPEVLARLQDNWIFGEFERFWIYDVVYIGFATSGGILMVTAFALLWLFSYLYIAKISGRFFSPMALFVLVFGFIVLFFDSTYFWPPTAFNFWLAYFLSVRVAEQGEKSSFANMSMPRTSDSRHTGLSLTS